MTEFPHSICYVSNVGLISNHWMYAKMQSFFPPRKKKHPGISQVLYCSELRFGKKWQKKIALNMKATTLLPNITAYETKPST